MKLVFGIILIVVWFAALIYAVIKADRAYLKDDIKNLIVYCFVILLLFS